MTMAETPIRTSGAVKFKLSLMMFLQYAIWGAWLPILYPFLLGYRGFSLEETGLCLSAGAIGAIFGPFLAGQLADRLFSTEKLLAASHFIGAILVYLLATADGFVPFVVLSGVYGFVYAPTLSLTNSISFAHIADRDRDFGPIRVWGTVGWIVAGILVGQWLLRTATPDLAGMSYGVSSTQLATDPDQFIPILLEENPAVRDSFAAGAANWAAEEKISTADSGDVVVAYMAMKIRKSVADEEAKVGTEIQNGGAAPTAEQRQAGMAQAAQQVVQAGLQDRGRRFAFSMSAILGLVMAVFCLFLPHTPPTRVEGGSQRKLAWAEAFSEIRLQPLLTLFLIAVPVSCIHQFYFVFTEDFLHASTTGRGCLIKSRASASAVAGLMTIGQMAEMLVLGSIPFFAKSLSASCSLIGSPPTPARMALFAYSSRSSHRAVSASRSTVCASAASSSSPS